MFYRHNGKKLRINNRKKFRKYTSMWKLNNQEEIIREIRKYFEMKKKNLRHNIPELMKCS